MSDSEAAKSYTFGSFRLMPEQRQLLDGDGRAVTLRGKAFDLLQYLIEHRGRVVTKTELLETLWPGSVVEENNLNQAASALRQALGDDAKTPKFVATIKGRGYQFVAEVSADSEAGDAPDAAISESSSRRSKILATVLAIFVLGVAALVYLDVEHAQESAGAAVIENFATATTRMVTDHAGSHSAPTLSPDGRMMAYVSDASGTPQIWVKNLQRGDPLQITGGPFPASSPSWSPEDDEIVFARNGPNGVSIFSVGTLGTPPPRQVIEGGHSPRFATNADEFVFSRGRQQVWLARNGGRDLDKVLGLPKSQGFARPSPALSPDGKLIAFVHADEGPLANLWVIPAAGGEARQLTTLEATGGPVSSPAWGPHGNGIVFTVNADTGSSHLWRVSVDGSDLEPVTSGPGGAGDAVVSADGKRLAFTATRTRWGLTRVDPETAESSTVFESRTPLVLPAISPDGSKVVFFSPLDSGMQLFTLGSDGANLQQLTFDDGGENALPAWAADGDSVLYYRGRSLHIFNPGDGNDEEVFADFHWSSRNWLAASNGRVSYHHIDRPARQQSTVVRSLGESDERVLPVPIEAAQWSPDGTELAGFFRQTGEIMICHPDKASCQTVEHNGAALIGWRPVWSHDGRRLYYLRFADAGKCCSLWRVNRDGSNNAHVASLDGFEPENSAYGIDSSGGILYNHVDRSTNEIWLASVEDQGHAGTQ